MREKKLLSRKKRESERDEEREWLRPGLLRAGDQGETLLDYSDGPFRTGREARLGGRGL